MTSSNKIKTVFCGTPDFSVPTLKSLYENDLIDLSLVVSMPDRPAGRGKKLKSPEVIEFAKEKNIPFLQTTNINQETLPDDIDLIIVLAFAQFLGTKLLNTPKLGCFNIHTSLLPKYRGAAPIQYALLNGDQSTGVSIQKMVKQMDAGDICHSKKIAITDDETGGSLYEKLKNQAGIEINDFIKKLSRNELSFTKQNENHASFAPTLKKEDGFLNFKKTNAQTLINKIRALYPWPGTYCFVNQKRLKVFDAEISSLNLNPGEFSAQFETFNIGCLDKTIRLKSVQLEGKNKTSDTELINGLKNSNTEIKINPEDK